MRKIVFGALLAIAALIGLASLAGITPVYLYHAPAVATGMGAKLLCSARYVSGFSRQQAFDDLTQYSPVLEYLSVDYDELQRTVSTSLFGLSEHRASYVPGLGCALEFDGYQQRHGYDPVNLPAVADRWPAGQLVGDPDRALQRKLVEQLERDNAAGLDTRALLVAHQGRVVAEAYADGFSPETPLLGWSMTKSLTGIMLGNLVLRGHIDLDDPAGFEAWRDDRRAGIRIEHLLTMTDGLAFDERYSPGDDVTEMLFTEPSASAYALQRPLIREPGSHFNYSSGSATLLARLFFRQTGNSLQSSYEAYTQYVAAPLGFQNAVFEVDSRGIFAGSAYLYAPARDWARIGQLMLGGGRINGQRVVSETWVEQATQPNGSANGGDYGYQWWLNRGATEQRWPDLPADAFAARGNREQLLMVIPSRELVMVRLGWTTGDYPSNDRIAEILENL